MRRRPFRVVLAHALWDACGRPVFLAAAAGYVLVGDHRAVGVVDDQLAAAFVIGLRSIDCEPRIGRASHQVPRERERLSSNCVDANLANDLVSFAQRLDECSGKADRHRDRADRPDVDRRHGRPGGANALSRNAVPWDRVLK